MLNVNELEDRYKKYKLKSYMPYITVVAGLSVVSIAALALLNYQDNTIVKEQSKNLAQNTITHETAIEKQTDTAPLITEAVSKQNNVEIEKEEKKQLAEEITDEKRVLSPSMDFIRKIQGTTPVYYDNPSNHVEPKQTKKVKKIIEEKRTVVNIADIHVEKEEVETKREEPKLSIEKKSSINIKRKETDSDIAHVIKRFKNNHNPALSLFVAKKYYQLGEYDKSYNYALITNDINNNIEASWIIFAKSLVKLDKKDEAIKTLEKYIKYSNSSEARILLDEILSGKFK